MIINNKALLKTFSHKLGNISYKRKYKKNPDLFLSLKQLCQQVNLDTNNFDADINEKLERIVSQISRYGDRFTKDCVCVQLYDDSDDTMRKAINDGALVCITNHKIEGIPCIVVENTYSVYADMCSIYRDFYKIKSTVVLGSIGKTTAKKMVAAVYNQKFNTLYDTGNDNILDSIGSISQHIPTSSEQFIAELSEDTPGLIKEMSKIIKPDIAIITTIDKSHIQFYKSEENIYNEFCTVTQHMHKDGVCIISLDEQNSANLITDKKVVFVSTQNKNADFLAQDIFVDTEGLKFNVVEKSTSKSFAVKLYNTFAIHNVTSALYAFAAGMISGMKPYEIINGLASYRPTGIRQNIYKSKGIIIYADCYNAVAKSVRSAINASCNIPITGKRVAVIGDVAEAGTYTQSTHDEIVDIINTSKVDFLFTCGKELKNALSRNPVRNDLHVLTFNNQKEMNKAIKKHLSKGDLVLFKSSHSGNLQKSISTIFPIQYFIQSIKYYTPRIKWHFKVILN
ncbi:MAG: UDP-N-acetylmuramoyl-tripeptide--D-alanyl-D-alanine ligase [Clostridia bacterium]|nr:UDP-N-acetylmuramoyl-tripeptide--D-alanyl-D-alanine ligase [Clostridia bacterium]